MVEYHSDLQRIGAGDLSGFFEGWSRRPDPQAHLRLLAGSTYFVVATSEGESRVVGYAAALSDGVLSAYISHLEVLAEFRRQGIGAALVRGLLERVGDLYMVDLVCDPDLAPFYEPLGFRRFQAMIRRNYDAQAGVSSADPRD